MDLTKIHRYLNVSVHLKETHFNLGRIHIHRSATAKYCVNLITERLKNFGPDFESDIIGITTTRASVI